MSPEEPAPAAEWGRAGARRAWDAEYTASPAWFPGTRGSAGAMAQPHGHRGGAGAEMGTNHGRAERQASRLPARRTRTGGEVGSVPHARETLSLVRTASPTDASGLRGLSQPGPDLRARDAFQRWPCAWHRPPSKSSASPVLGPGHPHPSPHPGMCLQHPEVCAVTPSNRARVRQGAGPTFPVSSVTM